MMGDAVRPPAVAGTFYPAHPAELARLVHELLAAVDAEPAPARAAMVPHAGLIYSGACAAQVFGRIPLPATLVLVGPNHRGVVGSGGGASAWARGAFATPLGDVPVASALAARFLERCPLAAHDPVAHGREHALEVELPFVVTLAPGAAIMPLLLAFDDWARCAQVAQALVTAVAAEPAPVLLVASSDMSHYESAARAARKDEIALAAIERLDGRALLDACRRERISMCGRAAAAAVMEAARRLGATRGAVVDYRHSGWVTGDDASVVSYAGVVIE